MCCQPCNKGTEGNLKMCHFKGILSSCHYMHSLLISLNVTLCKASVQLYVLLNLGGRPNETGKIRIFWFPHFNSYASFTFWEFPWWYSILTFIEVICLDSSGKSIPYEMLFWIDPKQNPVNKENIFQKLTYQRKISVGLNTYMIQYYLMLILLF